MKLLWLFRQSDSFKAAVLLLAAGLLLLGFCIRSAAVYAEYLRTPAEYICTAPAGIDKVLPQLSYAEGIRAYSRQKTAFLENGQQSVSVTMLSAAYLAECYGIPDDTRAVYLNAAAFSAAFGDVQSPVSFRGTLDGAPYSASVIRAEQLPQDEPLAVLAAPASALQNADALRICAAEQGAFSPESLGLTVTNRETLCAAEYEQELVLLRIRLGALAAFFALTGAGAFLHICKHSRREAGTECG